MGGKVLHNVRHVVDNNKIKIITDRESFDMASADDVTAMQETIDELNSALSDLGNANADNAGLLYFEPFDFTIGSIYDGDIVLNTKYVTTRMIKLNAGDKLKYLTTSLTFKPFLYTDYDKSCYSSAGAWTSEYVATEDTIVRVNSSNPTPVTYQDILKFVKNLVVVTAKCTLSDDEIKAKAYARFNQQCKSGAFDEIPEKDVEILKSNVDWFTDDMCIVGNDIWSFRSKYKSIGIANNIAVFIDDFNTQGVPKNQNLGSANGVDYRNNTLIMRDQVGNAFRMILYRNPELATGTLELSDSNCTYIDFTKTGYTLPAWIQACCFGNDNDNAYIVCPNAIYHVVLGMGDNDYSDHSASQDSKILWGTYASGKAPNEYNGTALVTDVYHGLNLNQVQCTTFYNGDIFVGDVGYFKGVRVYRLGLNKVTHAIVVKDRYQKTFVNDAGEVSSNTFESEGVIVKDNKVYHTYYNNNVGYLCAFNL